MEEIKDLNISFERVCKHDLTGPYFMLLSLYLNMFWIKKAWQMKDVLFNRELKNSWTATSYVFRGLYFSRCRKQIVKSLHAANSFKWHLYIVFNFWWKFKLKLPFTLCLGPINFLEVSIWKSSFAMPEKWGERRNHIRLICVQLTVQEILRTMYCWN